MLNHMAGIIHYFYLNLLFCASSELKVTHQLKICDFAFMQLK